MKTAKELEALIELDAKLTVILEHYQDDISQSTYSFMSSILAYVIKGKLTPKQEESIIMCIEQFESTLKQYDDEAGFEFHMYTQHWVIVFKPKIAALNKLVKARDREALLNARVAKKVKAKKANLSSPSCIALKQYKRMGSRLRTMEDVLEYNKLTIEMFQAGLL